MQGRQMHPVCLIGGTGRSGSTILRQMFARHPQVATLPTEARFLTDPDGIIDFGDAMRASWSPYLFDAKVKRLESLLRAVGSSPRIPRIAGKRDRARGSQVAGGSQGPAGRLGHLRRMVGDSALVRLRPRYWSVSLEDVCPSYHGLVDALVGRLVEFRFAGRWTGMPLGEASSIHFGGPDVEGPLREFCRAVIACIAEEQEATHFVEDTPFNLLGFDRIRDLLPESRLVHIHRDPRDVVASYLEKRWSPSDPRLAARDYATMMDRWHTIRESLPEDSYIELPLTTLVEEPQATLRRICEFWNLEWHPSLLEVDLSRSHTGRWRTDIPARDHAAVNEILAPYLERYVAGSPSQASPTPERSL